MGCHPMRRRERECSGERALPGALCHAAGTATIPAMLDITGSGSITTCDGVTRRDFLQAGTLGALGFSLSKMMAAQAEIGRAHV